MAKAKSKGVRPSEKGAQKSASASGRTHETKAFLIARNKYALFSITLDHCPSLAHH